jgi:hypothetical protein
LNSGGEPERDDTGLPPVDIEIPDDARELDRDVQAYYREQRALRRLERRSRLHGILAKDGIVLPLLACCLILALITGTLLTVFTAASDQGFQNLPGPIGPHSTATAPANPGAATTGPSPRASGTAHHPGRSTAAKPRLARVTLPDASMLVAGKSENLRRLSRTMLVLVQPGCSCAQAVAALAQIAAAAGARAYLVSSTAKDPAVSRLASQVGQFHASITVAVDSRDVLTSYRHGLTAILVGRDRVAAVAADLATENKNNFDLLRSALTR